MGIEKQLNDFDWNKYENDRLKKVPDLGSQFDDIMTFINCELQYESDKMSEAGLQGAPKCEKSRAPVKYDEHDVEICKDAPAIRPVFGPFGARLESCGYCPHCTFLQWFQRGTPIGSVVPCLKCGKGMTYVV